jgi:succinate-semialdehyde dehydrogenase/glutarate-semialdehyde dehydrogenase
LAARHLKKAVLELGGSDPFIVLADTDVAAAARAAAQARMIVSGQSCISAKRFLVQKPVYQKFLRIFQAELEKLRAGDPTDPATSVSPLSSAAAVDALHDQVKRSVKQGAVVVTGGMPLKRPGFFYAPTLLTNVKQTMPVWTEETFGPVAAVMPFTSDAQAAALANVSQYGLGSSVWTRSKKRAEFFTQNIEAGAVFVNSVVKSDPRLPFGGIKRSGFGRELADYGIKEFVNIKTVWKNS